MTSGPATRICRPIAVLTGCSMSQTTPAAPPNQTAPTAAAATIARTASAQPTILRTRLPKNRICPASARWSHSDPVNAGICDSFRGALFDPGVLFDPARARCPGAARHRRVEQRSNLVVRRLAEIGVMRADGVERLGRREADDLVALARDLFERSLRRDRHGEDEAPRLAAPDAAQRRRHRAAGGDAVIDDDHRAARYIDRRHVAAIEATASLDLGELALLLRRDVAGRRFHQPDDPPIEHQLRVVSADDGAEAELPGPRRP